MAFRKIGALWLKENDKGKFMSGRIDEDIPKGAKLMVFKNTYKREEKHPDYTINVADDDPAQQNQTVTRQTPAPPPADSIPFSLLIAVSTLLAGAASMIA